MMKIHLPLIFTALLLNHPIASAESLVCEIEDSSQKDGSEYVVGEIIHINEETGNVTTDSRSASLIEGSIGNGEASENSAGTSRMRAVTSERKYTQSYGQILSIRSGPQRGLLQSARVGNSDTEVSVFGRAESPKFTIVTTQDEIVYFYSGSCGL